MPKKIIVVIAGLLMFSMYLHSQDFQGQYAIQTAEGQVILKLKKNATGQYEGQLAGNGTTLNLQGQLLNGMLQGRVGDELDGIIFQASLSDGNLTMAMAEVDDYNNPIAGTLQTLIFQKQADNSAPENAATAESRKSASGQVIINDQVLSAGQIGEIEKRYGIKPMPGKYWYDTRSGLYGVIGYSAYGFMHPGHQYGSLKGNASNGNTGVVINGRELPQTEWAVWSYILGYWIQQGRYWLDDKGNAGYEGSPVTLVNLYVAAQQNAYRGKGGSGDNFWSGRFSAGNSDRGNTRGYVSVPGHGPIGYGF